MKKNPFVLAIFVFVIIVGAVNTTLNDYFLAGSQPGESGNFESPNQCNNCHGGYDQLVEPVYNWRGSMMAQAARDPLYLASLVIANQDAPESGDLCIRCHAPVGWLSDRSEPTDGSALTDGDMEGVQCDLCHKIVKPTPLGVNPFPDDVNYTDQTYVADQDYLSTITDIPPHEGNGMYAVHSGVDKRGPFIDATAKHQMGYSPFHSQAALCGTCHDVSNPVFNRSEDGSYVPNQLNQSVSDFSKYTMFPSERTYSEWLMSSFNSPEGVYSEAFGGNKANVSTCQDCHMQDVSGYGANKSGTPYRNNLPLHDFTGGNTVVSKMVAQLYPDKIDPLALTAGEIRTNYMLNNAALLQLELINEEDAIKAEVMVINQSGHKLPSGYPEGRRMWIQLQAFNALGALVYESGAYDNTTGVLTKENTKIYEIKLGMSEDVATLASEDGIKEYQAGESFHFVLNDMVVKDNRMPPMGFTNANFEAIQIPVVDYEYDDGQFWDETEYILPLETDRVNVKLMYQTISKEYADFLRDENTSNNAGQVFYDLYVENGMSAPVTMVEEDMYVDNSTQTDNCTFDDVTLSIYPNPTRGQIQLKLNLQKEEKIDVRIYNMSGRYIRTLINRQMSPGQYVEDFYLSDLNKGMYLIRLQEGQKELSQKIIIR
ncbi:T9SS type A sorting domain-containing protein [Carboxylicivirga caseinilyticus]|uniref:T9SS type A sorting domain-containing protein n=1 Tax=Carboxylicivirga caseinilyticus TaxID=3417572 RepID=UPI003D337585|nr:T9SS type A sorting domain-containing protein [Marinilabiliaceae bacterium A049]